jgi:hypothetical protein
VWPDAGSDATSAYGQFNRQALGAKCEGLWPERLITRGTGTFGHAPRRAAWREGLIGHAQSTKSLSGHLLDSNRTPGVTRPVNSSVASGHALTEKVTFHDRWRSNERNLKLDTWWASVKSRRCDRMMWSRPVSARRAVSLFLTALFFGVAYKYVFSWFGELSLGHLDSLTSSWAEHISFHSSPCLIVHPSEIQLHCFESCISWHLIIELAADCLLLLGVFWHSRWLGAAMVLSSWLEVVSSLTKWLWGVLEPFPREFMN